MYQGHLPDSGIQRHSAGDHFPYIVEVRIAGNGLKRYAVTGPGLCGNPILFETDADAEACARRLRTVSINEDAWAFEVEQISKVGDTYVLRIKGLIQKAEAHFAKLSPAERVRGLLNLAAYRFEHCRPRALALQPVPLFVDYYRRMPL